MTQASVRRCRRFVMTVLIGWIGMSIPLLGAITRDLTIYGSPMVFYDRADAPTISITLPVYLNSTQNIASVSVRIISAHDSDERITVDAIPEVADFNLNWNSTTTELSIVPKVTMTGVTGGKIETVLNHLLYVWPNVNYSHNPVRKFEISIIESGRAYGHPDNTLHFYQFISVPGGLSWTSAFSAASTQRYYGKTGYLATVTSQPEFAFITGQASGAAGWLGANDAATEGVWKWVAGPENGQQFWNGGIGGSAVNSMYAPWGNNQPDNAGNAEDYLQITTGGVFNDLPEGYGITGYIVEWGGMGEPGNTGEIRVLPSNAFKSAMGF